MITFAIKKRGMVQIFCGDCLDVLRGMGDNTVDSIVTDPPYGISFMGKKWDYNVPGVGVWEECLRVLKPGGHLLCACGTRTQHRMAVNIEDGGFEIRDLIAWVYGSGFPKSLNIGKAIDKKLGNERKVIGSRGVGFNDSEVYGTGKEIIEITKGNSEWEGWGTALKPAMELWTLARKPISEKNIAENCLKWGTGGLNIDGCRVGHNEDIKLTQRNGRANASVLSDDSCGFDNIKNNIASASPDGRFPANLIHDGSDEVVGLFPEQKSGKRSSEYKIGNEDGEMYNHGIYGKYASKNYDDVPASSGSAARFFYCAKASKADRDEGLNVEEKFFSSRPWCDEESYSDNRGRIATRLVSKVGKNHHPTVKPTNLMRYLCKLITPKNGIVLDPFMGSGSTGKGAVLEGFGFIGIDREQEYVDIAKARIAYVQGIKEDEEKKSVNLQLKLF